MDGEGSRLACDRLAAFILTYIPRDKFTYKAAHPTDDDPKIDFPLAKAYLLAATFLRFGPTVLSIVSPAPTEQARPVL